MAQPQYEEAPEEDKKPIDCNKTKTPVTRGGVEVAREVREAEEAREIREAEEALEVREAEEVGLSHTGRFRKDCS